MLVCGYALDARGRSDEQRIGAVIRHCLTEWLVEVLWYTGPQRISLRRLGIAAFRVVETIAPQPLDSEMLVDCTEELRSERVQRWLRSSLARAFDTVCKPKLVLTSEHYRLLESFFSSREKTEFLLNLAVQVLALAANGSAQWFEVWYKNKLVGLAATMDSFGDTDIAVFACSDRCVKGSADVLHAAMRETTRRNGKRFLNLGSSPYKGHYAFKRKWGGSPQHPPPWWQVWATGELANRSFDGWPSRIFGIPR